MNKYFVTPEIANVLRDIGFNDPCFKGVNSEGLEVASVWALDFNSVEIHNGYVSIPLWVQVLDWAVDVHGIFGYIVPCFIEEQKKYSYVVNGASFTEVGFIAPENAYEACVLEIIDFIKSRNESKSSSNSRFGEQEDNEHILPQSNLE